jgi:small GTP-binding protein
MSGQSVKVVFLGRAAVGKTCLVNRIVSGGFEPRGLSTITPSCICKHCTLSSGAAVALELWDTAGQERYRAVNQSYYRAAHVAVVCHDADFAGVGDWAARARDASPDCAVLAVLTKADLYTREQIREATERAAAIGEPFGARHCATSAMSGDGVDGLVQELAQAGEEALQRARQQEGRGVELEKTESAAKPCC